MKVLLVRSNPDNLQNTRLPLSLQKELGCVMPLGIAYIAAFLREKGIKVEILDVEAEGLTLDQVRQRISESQPDIVGITSMTPTVHNDLDVAAIAKELGARVVIGGPQAEAMPVETMSIKDVDYLIQGEGELPMYKLSLALEGKISFPDVPGLVYTSGGNTINSNGQYINDDLDSLPFPAWDLLPMDKYNAIISNGRLATLSPGRGCPFHCGFCFKQASDKKVRFRNPSSVADEIEQLINSYKIKEINFVSDTLTVNIDFIFGLCQEIIRRNINISWIAPTRADCVTKEMLQIMKRAGCKSLRYGVESGSPHILKYMGKHTDLERIIQAFRWAKEVKIETFAYLIIGYINETENSIKETLKFVKRLKPDMLMYNIAIPLPATRLWHQSVKAGIVDPDYWKRFIENRNTPRIPYLFTDADKWIKKAYREFYFSPRYVLKQVCKIRPNTISNYFKAFRGIAGLK